MTPGLGHGRQLPQVASGLRATPTLGRSPDDAPPGAPRAVVGLQMADPPGVHAALSWAVVWAVEHGARLDVLTSRDDRAATRGRTAAVRALIASCLEQHAGGALIPVSLFGTTEAAGPALVRSARGADLLVVGADERARSGRRRPGSALAHCLTHAEGAVLVAPSTAAAPVTAWSVVVGVDGSARSRGALRRARWEAASGGDLTMVTVVDEHHGWPRDQSWVRPVARVRRSREDLRDIVGDSGAVPLAPRPRHRILHGSPVGVLASQRADLLVIGAPARRSQWGWLPTSTVRRCLAHREGAVLMVPFAERGTGSIR